MQGYLVPFAQYDPLFMVFRERQEGGKQRRIEGQAGEG